MKRKFNLEDSGVDKVKVKEYRTACFATKNCLLFDLLNLAQKITVILSITTLPISKSNKQFDLNYPQ